MQQQVENKTKGLQNKLNEAIKAHKEIVQKIKQSIEKNKERKAKLDNLLQKNSIDLVSLNATSNES